MSFIFKPAIRENASTLTALAGPSGGGKTKTALRLATGLAGNGKIAVIDTEAARATHYADQYRFDHCDMKPPFSPGAFREAIEAADKAGYAVVIIDSMSHEWAGDGGVLIMQEMELQRMAGDDWKKREACKMAAWIKPKGEHKRMISRLLQCRAHLIFCLRAEEKVEMRKVEGKTVIMPLGWQPICEKNFMYEMTCSFLLSDTARHLATPIKLQDQHRPFFPADQPIGERAGEQLAAWARGGGAQSQPIAPTAPEGTAAAPTGDEAPNQSAPPSDLEILMRDMLASAAKADDRKIWWTDHRKDRDTLKAGSETLYARFRDEFAKLGATGKAAA